MAQILVRDLEAAVVKKLKERGRGWVLTRSSLRWAQEEWAKSTGPGTPGDGAGKHAQRGSRSNRRSIMKKPRLLKRRSASSL